MSTGLRFAFIGVVVWPQSRPREGSLGFKAVYLPTLLVARWFYLEVF